MNEPTGETEGQWVLKSRLLSGAGFRHAFFTRRGGVSGPPFDSLNFLASAGDDASSVAENRRRAAAHLGIAMEHLFFLSQVHGTQARELRRGDDWNEVVHTRGDITLSLEPGIGCGVRSADCVPVLLADRESGAVCAVHSGWKGTVANAAGAGVRALRALVGGRGDLLSAIGPHIERCCFEVGEDVGGALARASSAGPEALVGGDQKQKVKADLRMIVRAQLGAEGVTAIDDVLGCTMCRPDLFFSYRRDGARSGRLLSAIVAGI